MSTSDPPFPRARIEHGPSNWIRLMRTRFDSRACNGRHRQSGCMNPRWRETLGSGPPSRDPRSWAVDPRRFHGPGPKVPIPSTITVCIAFHLHRPRGNIPGCPPGRKWTLLHRGSCLVNDIVALETIALGSRKIGRLRARVVKLDARGRSCECGIRNPAPRQDTSAPG